MAIDLFCYVSGPLSGVQSIVNLMSTQHQGLFSTRFLISEVWEANETQKEIALEHGLGASCVFLIRLNDKSAADLLSEVELVVRNAFGDNDVVILFNNETQR
jgi:hypothetical protein